MTGRIGRVFVLFAAALAAAGCGAGDEPEVVSPLGTLRQAVINGVISPDSQSINEGQLASWSGSFSWLQSTDGTPVELVWDFHYSGTFEGERVLCDSDSATAAPDCNGGAGSPCSLAAGTWTCNAGTSFRYFDSGTHIAAVSMRATGGNSTDNNNVVNVNNLIPNGAIDSVECTDGTFCPDAATLVEGAELTFTASGNDPGGDPIARWIWEFSPSDVMTCHDPAQATDSPGCGATAQSPVQHTYAEQGSYTVRFTACDEDPAGTYNCDPTPATRTISVQDSHPLVSTLVMSPAAAVEGALVSFEATLAAPADDAITVCHWDYDGDGVIDETVDPCSSPITGSFTFADGDPTTVTTRLQVLDEEGTVADGTEQTHIHDVLNAPPVVAELALTPAENHVEGSPITFDSSFADPASPDSADADWSAEWDDSYDGSTFTTDVIQTYSVEGAITRTMTPVDQGSFIVGLRTRDQSGAGDYSNEVFTNEITVVNAPPSVAITTPATGTTVNEGDTVSFGLEFDDPGTADNPWEVRWIWGDSSADTVNAHHGPVPGTDFRDHVMTANGTITVTARVTDKDLGMAEDTVTLTVNDVSPSISSLTATPSSGSEPLSVTFEVDAASGAASAEADPITRYEWDFDNDGVIDQTTSVSTVTHVYEDNPAGGNTWTARVVVWDEDSSAEETTSVVVENVAPTIDSLTTNSPASEGEYVTAAIAWTDPGTADTFTLDIDWGDGTTTQKTLPAGTSRHSTTHRYGDDGEYTITVRITDDDGESDEVTESVTVADVPPTITSLMTNAPVMENSAARVWVIAEAAAGDSLTFDYDWDGDPNGDGDFFNDPADLVGAAVNHAEFTSPDDRIANVRVRVRDDDGNETTDAIQVVWLNGAPSIGNVLVSDSGDSDSSVSEGEAVTLTISASDPAGASDPLQYSIDWFNDGDFTSQGDVFQSPVNAHSEAPYVRNGSYVARVRVEDGDGASSEAWVTINVADLPPTFASPAATDSGPVAEGSAVSLTIDASDPAGDPLRYGFDWNNDGTIDAVQASPSASHVYRDDGTHTVGIQVSDDSGKVISTSVTVTVTNVAPTIVAPTPGTTQTLVEGRKYIYQLRATDPAGDSDPLTYSATLTPASPDFSVDTHAGTLSWTPTYGESGVSPGKSYTVDIRVDDGDTGSATELLTLRVVYRDDDGDGMADTWEVANGMDPTRDDSAEDLDGDGIPNGDEFRQSSGNLEPPGQPVAASPADRERTSHGAFDVALTISDSFDPDGTVVAYQFQVFDSETLQSLVYDTDPANGGAGDVAPGGGMTSLTLDDTDDTDQAGTANDDASNPHDVDLVDDGQYWWRARAIDDDGMKGLWSVPVSFQYNPINKAPDAPELDAPRANEVVANRTPRFTLRNVIDADGDALSYGFAVFSNGTCTGTPVMSASDLPSGDHGMTEWRATAALEDDAQYCWVATVSDGVALTTSDPAVFRVNTANNEPSAPGLSAPAVGAIVSAGSLTLEVTNATDADGDTLTYWFEVDSRPEFGSAESVRSGAIAEGAATTTFAVSGLSENTRYYWRARAFDGWSYGDWTSGQFLASDNNEAPTVPVPLSPVGGGTVESTQPVLVAGASRDPELGAVRYTFTVYALKDGKRGDLAAEQADVPADANGLATWSVSPALEQGKAYEWMVLAVDAEGASSAPSEAARFQVPEAAGCSAIAAGPSFVPVLAILLLALGRRRRS